MTTGCDLCGRIERTERGENPFTVVRTTTGYVNLGDVQYHEGYTVFVAKRCVPELHLLPPDERDAHLHEMALVAEAVFTAFAPRKLNYELLGERRPARPLARLPSARRRPEAGRTGVGGPGLRAHDELGRAG